MIFLAGLLNRSSLSFVLVSIVRLFSILSILFLFASEIYLIVDNIKGIHNGSQDPTFDSGSHNQSPSQNATNQTTSSGYINDTIIPTTFGGVLFFVLAQLFNIVILILCLLSELSFPPLPRQTFGVGILGSLQVYVSCTLLSHHLNKTVRASSWLLFVLGIINLILGIIFGRRIRTKRSLLDASTAYVKKTTHVDDIETGFNFAQNGFRKGKKVFKTVRPSMIGKPQEIQEKNGEGGSEITTAGHRPLEISKPIIDYLHHRKEAAENPNHPQVSIPLPTEPSPIYSSYKTLDLPKSSSRRIR